MKLKPNWMDLTDFNCLSFDFSLSEVVAVVRNTYWKLMNKYNDSDHYITLPDDNKDGLYMVFEDTSVHGSPTWEYSHDLSLEESNFIKGSVAFLKEFDKAKKEEVERGKK